MMLKALLKALFKPTPWNFVGLFIVIAGLVVAIYRFIYGLGAITNLSDKYPWGIWIAFDVMSGVALAAGGFLVAGTVHIFNLKDFKPILRPAVLTAFLGYFLVIIGLLVDLGLPWRIYHPLIYPQVHSAMLEVALCVMAYFTVLFFEFLPAILQRFKLKVAYGVIHGFTVPLVVAGVVLSCLHQSSLGSLLLLTKEQLSPLWYSPSLPFTFFLQAIAIGLGMVIFECHMSSRMFGLPLENKILTSLGKAMSIILGLYFVWKLVDMTYQGSWAALNRSSFETSWFAVEWVIGVIIPFVIMAGPLRANPTARFWGASMVVFGIILARINASLTGMSVSMGEIYVPSWQELLISAAIISAGLLIFQAAVRNLPVMEPDVKEAEIDMANS